MNFTNMRMQDIQNAIAQMQQQLKPLIKTTSMYYFMAIMVFSIIAIVCIYWILKSKEDVKGDFHSYIDPEIIGYSQDSIAGQFWDGESVYSSDCKYTIVEACYHNGALYAINNRILFNARHNKRYDTEVKIVDPPFRWKAKLSTKNEDASVRVRPPKWSFQDKSNLRSRVYPKPNLNLGNRVYPKTPFNRI